MPEFDLIKRLQGIIKIDESARAAPCFVGIGDDAAVLDIPADRQLVVCTDTLVAGVHFPEHSAPAAIGHKSLAVNLSDLAAMGADPAWFFMALSLPAEDDRWLESFAGGVARLADRAGIVLAGGDVSSGPLSVCITALGLVARGTALTRAGAQPGDLIAVSGQTGSAALALRRLEAGFPPDDEGLLALEYPEPRLGLGRALRGVATSCIDLSDGMLADLGHILEASGAGAVIELDKLPCAASLEDLPDEERWALQLAGGDDYELCFTLPQESRAELGRIAEKTGIPLTVIGTVTGEGLELRTPAGERFEPRVSGYQHFGRAGAGER